VQSARTHGVPQNVVRIWPLCVICFESPKSARWRWPERDIQTLSPILSDPGGSSIRTSDSKSISRP
jgi:hypothetical protein